MTEIIFYFLKIETKIKCNINEKIETTGNRYTKQINKEINNSEVNGNLTFFEHATEIDILIKVMNIDVYLKDILM